MTLFLVGGCTAGWAQITPILYVDGNMGIGTSSPRKGLHVYSGDGKPTLRLEAGPPVPSWSYASNDIVGSAGGGFSFYWALNPAKHFDHDPLAMNKMAQIGSGFFSIPDPNDNNIHALYFQYAKGRWVYNNFKVKANGYVYARQIEVQATGNFPDYVFDDEYELKSLQEVEAFIEANHHLPDVPSAKEIEENGHNLGQMDEILLKKVEELTLYILELKKQNDQLTSKVEALEQAIK